MTVGFLRFVPAAAGLHFLLHASARYLAVRQRQLAARRPRATGSADRMAGAVGLELTTPGFGDRCSAN